MSDFHQLFAGQLQALAISHAAWKGTLDALVAALARASGEDHSADIRRLLYSQPLRAALHGRDVALWCGHDGLFRLIDQTPVGFPAACRRVRHHPGPQTCRYCLLTEPHALQPELEPERDPRGEFVPGSFVHPRCAAAWARLRAQVAQRETTT